MYIYELLLASISVMVLIVIDRKIFLRLAQARYNLSISKIWYNLGMEGVLQYSSAIGVIVLAALVHATLQMNLGSLLLLYHESLGKHIKKRTKFLVSNYIFGVFFSGINKSGSNSLFCLSLLELICQRFV